MVLELVGALEPQARPALDPVQIRKRRIAQEVDLAAEREPGGAGPDP